MTRDAAFKMVGQMLLGSDPSLLIVPVVPIRYRFLQRKPVHTKVAKLTQILPKPPFLMVLPSLVPIVLIIFTKRYYIEKQKLNTQQPLGKK
jgi:hypothetical protein